MLSNLVSPFYAWYACTNLPALPNRLPYFEGQNCLILSSIIHKYCVCMNLPRPGSLWKSSYSRPRS
jgi:hypothetical protein